MCYYIKTFDEIACNDAKVIKSEIKIKVISWLNCVELEGS